MAWASRFTAVPTSELRQDGALDPLAKATREQMRGYMRNVPAVYDRLRSGATEADFEAMRTGADPQEREIGDAYYHLFSSCGYDHRIEADYTDGQGLVVQRGGHRVEAARELGVGYLPVHVRAADQPAVPATPARCASGTGSRPRCRACTSVLAAHRARPARPGPAVTAHTPPTPPHSCPTDSSGPGCCGTPRPGSTGTPPSQAQGPGGHHDRRQGRTAREAPGTALDSTPKRLPGASHVRSATRRTHPGKIQARPGSRQLSSQAGSKSLLVATPAPGSADAGPVIQCAAVCGGVFTLARSGWPLRRRRSGR